jgi:hypothetical protein
VFFEQFLNNTVWQKVARFECFQCLVGRADSSAISSESTGPKFEQNASLEMSGYERAGLKFGDSHLMHGAVSFDVVGPPVTRTTLVHHFV